MGKKNRRNRTKKNKIAAGATTTAEDPWSSVLDGIFLESEAAVSSATAVGNSGGGTRACYHGSNKEAFRKDQYRKAGREYVENFMAQQNEEECLHCVEAFKRKHAQLMIDEEFGKYLFAVCVQVYLLHGYSEDGGVQSRAMQCLLHLAIGVRYVYAPFGEGKDVFRDIDYPENVNKYTRDLLTVRGVVNVLVRETRDCGCSLAAVLDGIFLENEAAVLSATVVGYSGDDTRSCYHGSNKEAFQNDQYRKAGLEWVESQMEMVQQQQSTKESLQCNEAFRRKHARLMIDKEFGKYLFAVCAQDYLLHGFVDGADVRSRTMRCLLILALGVRYAYVPWGEGKDEYNEKVDKYMRDLSTVRGVVNVLVRETRDCGCLKDAKKAAKTMEKVGRCAGCDKVFPKEKLLKCPCGIPQYCTRECQVKDWHRHKDHCTAKSNMKSKSKTNTANGVG